MGEIELSKVKKLPCSSGQFFGRPNWGRIFKKNHQEHKGSHIGVFLCGSPIIGKELERQSKMNSDPVDRAGGTRFSFYKELLSSTVATFFGHMLPRVRRGRDLCAAFRSAHLRFNILSTFRKTHKLH